MVKVVLKSDRERPGWLVFGDVDYQVGGSHRRISSRSHVWRPPTDVYETEDAVVVRVEIPGMREADFSIFLEDRNLIISGVRPDRPERRAYQQMEIHFGEFRTDIALHSPVDTDTVEAEYDDGFLRLVLPKTKPRHIKIE
jgi:HSP20 family protein